MIALKYPWRYYIWDLGGTLMDNYQISTAAFLQALTEFGLVDSLPGDSAAAQLSLHDAVYQALRVSTDHAMSRFAADVPGFAKRYRELEAENLKHPFLFLGATEVLTAVMESGGANFLVSHRDNQVLDILKGEKIADKFTDVVTKDNGFARKPNPEAFDYLIDKYHINRDETVTVGDRLIDIEAGVAAGIATVYFDPPKTCDLASVSINALTDLLVG